MKYLSLFSGIGGFEKAIQDVVANVTCIGFSEIDKYASAIYKYHYPEHKELGNARDIICQRLPDFDLLVGGFPCQAFSIAGKRKGFDDTRGTLFFEIARILRDKRPRHFMLENVKGLLSHDDGKTFITILGVLSGLGYRVEWQVLNSVEFGVPQNRERVFIVGHLRGECERQVFPIEPKITEHYQEQEPAKAPVARTLSGGGNSGGNHSGMTMIGTLRTHKDGQGFREMKSGDAPALAARAREDGSGQAVIIQRPHGHNQGGEREFPCLRSSSFEHNDFLMQDMCIRRLTPVECERLQGFPDNWTKYGIIDGKEVKISDTQRYKCCGNAVTTNVIAAVISKLKDCQ